ncbi:hypothetical protein PHJA_002206600 [Phtheirospermum japonicum]|uniref:Rieske-like [2Fe-2S] domain-containing protein n=1 Tax=Phtheirospermum japonicum TaxID=374723 RepID=A0A830CMR7_9LAMI|nr:hypothetical protein PHJA_002206600 [Phtheirospermum japonicum]
MATAATKFTIAGLFSAAPSPCHHKLPPYHHLLPPLVKPSSEIPLKSSHNGFRVTRCKATEVSPPSSSSAAAEDGKSWVPVVPLSALPKGERRVIIQDGETVLLLWYKDGVFAIENRSPAEGAYSEGLLNAKLTQVRMIIDEGQEGFGFTGKNEIINGKAAVIGFLLLLDFELLTGKGLLKGTGFLDFIYSISNALQ